MFSRHTKDPVKTWRDFYFDLQTYFDGWLKESKVTTLEELKDLIVADQIKKKTLQDYKDHFLDQWCNWNNPLQLVDKLDSYEKFKNMRNKNNKNFSWKQKEMNSSPWRSNYTQNPKLSYKHPLSGFPSQSRRETGIPSNTRRNPISKDRIPEKKIVDTKRRHNSCILLWMCAPGIIRSRCHNCNSSTKDDAFVIRKSHSHGPINFENARGNRTLLGIDFLTAAGIVLDLQRKQWYFTETSHRKYNFVKAPPNSNALLTVDPDPHPCQLRKNEGTHLSLPQREEINSLLEILIPKPNGTFRLCIDYRKLNEITVADDTYPLPRMDDLLQQAKLTPFMFTLDLRAGYHQVKVHVEDQDKTAFVCPFGTYRFLRMPYDASNYALGAVLLQGEGSDEHPIEYASRLLTPAERNYSTTEREALCCDMLSRPVTQEEESFAKKIITIADMPTRSCKDMREAQLKDDNLKKIIDSFKSPLKTEEYANWTERGFLMNQGVLHRYVPDADSAEAQLVIPTAERELIMEDIIMIRWLDIMEKREHSRK
ncbi:hypothetical protein TNCV_982901 [Trichonephila clavipes]|nr:hypothetical protein TNCV_982901 [Trichonephila clavipes]